MKGIRQATAAFLAMMSFGGQASAQDTKPIKPTAVISEEEAAERVEMLGREAGNLGADVVERAEANACAVVGEKPGCVAEAEDEACSRYGGHTAEDCIQDVPRRWWDFIQDVIGAGEENGDGPDR